MDDSFEIVPLGDRVIVKALENTETVKNGIIIPEMHKERPIEGIVIAVGETATKVHVGDSVFYGKYAGSEIVVDDNKYLVMNQEDIIGFRHRGHLVDMCEKKNGKIEVAISR